MILNEAQHEVIEQMAACNYAPGQIAVYLGVNKEKFLLEWHNHDSVIRYHYDKGVLKADFDISKKRLENATSGNLTADQVHQKETERRKFENVKAQILFCGAVNENPTKNEPEEVKRLGAGRPD